MTELEKITKVISTSMFYKEIIDYSATSYDAESDEFFDTIEDILDCDIEDTRFTKFGLGSSKAVLLYSNEQGEEYIIKINLNPRKNTLQLEEDLVNLVKSACNHLLKYLCEPLLVRDNIAVYPFLKEVWGDEALEDCHVDIINNFAEYGICIQDVKYNSANWAHDKDGNLKIIDYEQWSKIS